MASADHDWENCPHSGINNVDLVQITRQNHFYHDSLGCPFECSEDHNHPEVRRKVE